MAIMKVRLLHDGEINNILLLCGVCKKLINEFRNKALITGAKAVFHKSAFRPRYYGEVTPRRLLVK